MYISELPSALVRRGATAVRTVLARFVRTRVVVCVPVVRAYGSAGLRRPAAALPNCRADRWPVGRRQWRAVLQARRRQRNGAECGRV